MASIGVHIYKKKPRLSLAENIRIEAKHAEKCGIKMGCCQIFARNPRGYERLLSDSDLEELATLPYHIFIHANYPAILTSKKGIAQIIANMDMARKCHASMVVHFANMPISDLVHAISELPTDVSLYMENEVTNGEHSYNTIDELRAFMTAAPRGIGICIDTAHLWAMGISMRTKEDAEHYLHGLRGLMREFPDSDFIFHLNDSKVTLGKRLDRHAVFGTNIWKDMEYSESGLATIVDFAEKYEIDLIMESREKTSCQEYLILKKLL